MPMTDPQDSSFQQRVAQVRRRSFLGRFAAAAGPMAGAGGCLLGAAVLLGRALEGRDLPGTAGWSAAAAVVVGSLAWGLWRARAGAMGAGDAATWLDLEGGATGELVTAAELGERARDWAPAVERRASAVGRVYPVDWRRPLTLAALGALFFLSAGLAPLRALNASGALTELFDERIEEVREQLAALDEQLELEPEEAEALEEALDRLEADVQAEPDLEATYEAIDRIEEQLAEVAQEAVQAAQESLDALAEAAREAALNAQDPGGASPEATARMEAALEAAMEGLEAFDPEALARAGELGGFDAGALEDLAAQASTGKLDLAAAAELSQEMREALAEALAELGEAGLLDSGAMASLSELPQLTKEQLEMLAEAAELAAAQPCPECGREDPGEPGEP